MLLLIIIILGLLYYFTYQKCKSCDKFEKPIRTHWSNNNNIARPVSIYNDIYKSNFGKNSEEFESVIDAEKYGDTNNPYVESRDPYKYMRQEYIDDINDIDKNMFSRYVE